MISPEEERSGSKTPTDANSVSTVQDNPKKRPVARRACLSCRERKIRCDGEAPSREFSSAGPQICSNCRYLGLECVFVRSNRGGRKRKGAAPHTPDTSDVPRIHSTIDISLPPTLGANPPTRNQIDFLHSKTHPDLQNPPNKESTSPSVDSQSNSSSSAFFNNQRVRNSDFRDDFSRQSPPFGHRARRSHYRHHYHRGEDVPPMNMNSGPNSGPSHPGPFPYFAPDDAFRGSGYGPPPTPPGQQHHRFGYGPPPGVPHAFGYPPGVAPMFGYPPPRFGYGPPGAQGPSFPFPNGMSNKKWNDMYEGNPNPPAAVQLPPIDGTEVEQGAKKRAVSKDSRVYDYDVSMSETNHPRSSLFFTKEDANFDFPDDQTCHILLDLFYRYINPSIPIIGDKNTFITKFTPRTDAALLHSVFVIAAPYASARLIEREEYRDYQYWYKFVEKYWNSLRTFSLISASLFLVRHFTGLGKIEEAHKFLEKASDNFDLFNLLDIIKSKDASFYQKLSTVCTKEQLGDRAQLSKLVWFVCGTQAYYKAIFDHNSTKKKLPTDIELPFGSHEQKMLNCKDIEEIPEIEVAFGKLNSGQFLAEVIYFAENVIDFKDRKDIDSKLRTLISLSNSRLYELKSTGSSSVILGNKTILIDSYMLMSSFFLNYLLIHNKINLIKDLLIFHPVNNFQYKNVSKRACMETLIEVMIRDFNISNVTVFLDTFKCSVSVIRLLNLGYGLVPEDENKYLAALETKDFDTLPLSKHTSSTDLGGTEAIGAFPVTADKDLDIPDPWIAYPILVTQIVLRNIYILASVALLVKYLAFELCTKDSTHILTVKLLVQQFKDQHELFPNGDSRASKEEQLEIDVEDVNFFQVSELNLDKLVTGLRLSHKFLKCQARYLPAIRCELARVEDVIEYVEDAIKLSQ